MAQRISQRGPDDFGIWLDPQNGVALAHQRLSILDLSDAGHQPMVSQSGRFVISFNGEIYNHLELRDCLKGQIWKGNSDTETLLAGFEAWGIQHTLTKAVGMFAFAAWDQAALTFTLARDRIGEKPLYYGWQGSSFLFGSELKALKEHPEFAGRINRNALARFTQYSYVPAPDSIYEGIFKLEPGCMLTVSLRTRKPQIVRFWSITGSVLAARANPFQGGPQDAVAALDHHLSEAIGQQMLADVPLGAFLSGGIDSSTIVALMQARSSTRIRTFSVGFEEAQYDEARFAAAVSKHLGTEHTALYVTPRDALNVIPQLPNIYDEPFADSSQIPTYLLSRLAREQVTVSLSGDGGDELFCGYNRYLHGDRLWSLLSPWPIEVRRQLARVLTQISPQAFDSLSGALQWALPRRYRFANFGDKVHKLAGVLESNSPDALYLRLVSQWIDASSVVLGTTASHAELSERSFSSSKLANIEKMMVSDMSSYLPDDILCKVDRAAMAVSLETRAPFLSHNFVEFAWTLPLAYKFRDGYSKWVLRQVLYKYVPQSLVDRPKMGFSMPIGAWLRGPLRQWAEGLISEERLQREGYFKSGPIRKKWLEHLSGRRNWQHQLWNILMFQAWLETQ